MYYNTCLIALTAMLGFGLPLRHTLLMHGERQRRIALDAAGKVHISYLDYTNFDLKYAMNASITSRQ